MHAAQRHDGVQVLGFHYQGRLGVLGRKQGGGVGGQDLLLATPSAAPTYGHMGPGGNGGGYGGRMETDGFGDEGDSNYHTAGSGSLVGGVSGGQYYSHGYPPQGGGYNWGSLPVPFDFSLGPSPLNGLLVFPRMSFDLSNYSFLSGEQHSMVCARKRLVVPWL